MSSLKVLEIQPCSLGDSPLRRSANNCFEMSWMHAFTHTARSQDAHILVFFNDVARLDFHQGLKCAFGKLKQFLFFGCYLLKAITKRFTSRVSWYPSLLAEALADLFACIVV